MKYARDDNKKFEQRMEDMDLVDHVDKIFINDFKKAVEKRYNMDTFELNNGLMKTVYLYVLLITSDFTWPTFTCPNLSITSADIDTN